MPITMGNVSLELKLLPLVLLPDGSSKVSVRKGYTDENNKFVVISTSTYTFTPTETAAVLDAPPVADLTRRDDLSLAVYGMLVSKGYASGTIS